MYTYAVGDIHGRYDILLKVLEYIEDQQDDEVTVVFLGDYVDRGPDSKKVLETLFRLRGKNPDRFIMLKGNHEDMMADTFDTYMWYINGGQETVSSYGSELGHLEFHKEEVGRLPTLYEDEYRYYVHAAYSDRDKDRMWYRYSKEDDPKESKYVVHGHTPQKISPFVGKGRCNLDMGSFFSGQVAVAKFHNNVPGGPISVHVVNVD